MKKILSQFFKALSLAALCVNLSFSATPQDIEQAIKKSDLLTLERWASDKAAAPILTKEERSRYLELAQESIDNAKKNYDDNALSLKQTGRGLLGIFSSAAGISGIYIASVLFHNHQKNYHVKFEEKAIFAIAFSCSALVSYLGVSELNKSYVNFDAKQVYNNARIILHLLKDIPTN